MTQLPAFKETLNLNSPYLDEPEIEEVIAGGYLNEQRYGEKGTGRETKKNDCDSKLPHINLKAILISSIIFIIVIVWFNVITNIFNEIFPEPGSGDQNNLLFFRTIKSFWYALFITSLSLLVCLIIYFW